MTDQERDDVPMSLRNVELPRFPLRSTSMCIPVRDDEYEEDITLQCVYQ
jgi:cyclic nucleotide gated channel